ncbi:adenylyltransferase/cytidyltransferase family protein [Pirellulales bacterium]|nr:adenylyltransferase/cytidyltransferase family protein [Pirellulales bacterium]
MSQVVLSASFDDLQARHMRLLQESRKLGDVHVCLWTDDAVRAIDGKDPKFPEQERHYFVDAIRYVNSLALADAPTRDSLPLDEIADGSTWAVEESEANSAKEAFCRENGLEYCVIPEQQLAGFPETREPGEQSQSTEQKNVIVTGCYDWFHSGHVRFFEEVSELGRLHVVVGHDANIKLLKGEGHPMYSEDQRRYMAGSIRFVEQAYVSSGDGWLDAEPEIKRIKPDIYAVNEDGDVPEKRDYCAANDLEYRVLRRTPKEGLPKRQSTDLRGF